MYENYKCKSCGKYVAVGPIVASAFDDSFERAMRAQSAHAMTHPQCVDLNYIFFDTIQLSTDVLDNTADVVDMR